MYVATFGGGLNRLLSLNKEQATFKAYTMKNGLPSDVLLSIERRCRRQFVVRHRRRALQVYTGYGEDHKLPLPEFFRDGLISAGRAALRTHSDYLMFNTVKGILYFFPDSIHISTYTPPIIFTACSKRKRR